MRFRWMPPVRRGLLASGLRERRARRLLEEQWEELVEATLSIRPEPALFVSLTSHAPRFGTLALTLKSLLLQDLRPEAVVLWIGDRDVPALPAEVRELERLGLQIRACEDHRSHTKYVHALREWPHARIAICDDDAYYGPRWLADLVAGERPGEIPCHRIHRLSLDEDGLPDTYRRWYHDSAARDASPLNFPTGVGGVLLRLDKLDRRVLDMDLARSICPTADDLWLYAMARRAGTRFRLVGPYEPLVIWRTSQDSALWRVNVVDRGNDKCMAAMIDRFGADFLGEPAPEWLAA